MILTDKEYDSIYSKVPRICVDIVIGGRGKFHLVMRDIQPYKGKYHLPGGRVRFRESITNAVQRIALKEIGCHVKIKKMIGFMEFPREIQGGSNRHSISIVFLCTANVPKRSLVNVHPVHLKFLKSL